MTFVNAIGYGVVSLLLIGYALWLARQINA